MGYGPPPPDYFNTPDAPDASQLTGATSAAAGLPQMQPGAPTPPPQQKPRGGAVKNYLANFLYNFGEAAKKEAGLETDYERNTRLLNDQLTQARTAGEQADARFRNAQTNQLGSMVTLPNGIQLPFAVAQKIYPELVKNEGKVEVAKINQGLQVPVPDDIAAKYGLQPGSTIGDKALGRLQAMGGKNVQKSSRMVNGVPHIVYQDKVSGEVLHDLGPDPTLAINAAKARAIASARADFTPFQSFDENGNLTTISNGQAIANGVPSASAWNTLYGATGSTKSQGQAAQAVAAHIPEFQQSVQNLAAKGELGPVMGRLNTYLTQGYGGNDKDVAEFVTAVGLLKSGAVRAHFGARGGAQILSKFDGLLNTAQTPEALIGASNEIGKFLQGYGAAASNANTPKTSIQKPGAAKATHRFNPATGQIEAIK